MTCRTPGCRRATRESSSGIVAVHCDNHLRRYLADAFGDSPRSWFDRARAHQLPSSIVGGSPVTVRPDVPPLAGSGGHRGVPAPRAA